MADAPSIADYGLLSDCSSAALVSRAGSIDWCAMPRLDQASCFGRLLDRERGGHCAVKIAGGSAPAGRDYRDGTLVLVTRIRGDAGTLALTDCLLRDDEDPAAGVASARLLRVIECLDGEIGWEFELCPRFDYGAVAPWLRRHDDRVHSATGGSDALRIWSDLDLVDRDSHALVAHGALEAGERRRVLIEWMRPELIDAETPATPEPDQLDRALEQTTNWWRRWSSRIPDSASGTVARSAVVLRGLSHLRTGAIAAAATTSLPEGLGARGERNWDYRYSWVRDSTLAVRSLARLGLESEADDFRRFIERSAAGHAADLQVVFGLDGGRRIGELELGHLDGYRGAKPVRVGNQAAQQLQLDAYGMLLEQSWRWHERGHPVDEAYWVFLVDLVEAAAESLVGAGCRLLGGAQ